jgi:hypothetical protein
MQIARISGNVSLRSSVKTTLQHILEMNNWLTIVYQFLTGTRGSAVGSGTTPQARRLSPDGAADFF